MDPYKTTQLSLHYVAKSSLNDIADFFVVNLVWLGGQVKLRQPNW